MTDTPSIILKHRIKILLEVSESIAEKMPHYHQEADECHDCDLLIALRQILREFFT